MGNINNGNQIAILMGNIMGTVVMGTDVVPLKLCDI